MLTGVSGGLISTSFVQAELGGLAAQTNLGAREDTALIRILSRSEIELGPASGLRAIADVAAVPLFDLLGYRVAGRSVADGVCRLTLAAGSRPATALVALWTVPPEGLRRDLLRSGIAADARWSFFCNGRTLRLVDSHRPWSRHHLEFDLRALIHDADARALLWTIAHAHAIDGSDPLLDRAVEHSARHGVEVCRALSDGVLQALDILLAALDRRPASKRRRMEAGALLEQSLTVLYRVLFLLFAEARALVPVWDPIYRDRYTLETIVATLITGRRYRGIWPALQAISRLAHAGCRAGNLKVTAFNGRLFSPTHAPAMEHATVDDESMTKAVLAVSTLTRRGRGRQRILYHDLDVEQLGAVYEHVLDYEVTPAARLERTGDRRKATGTFYTPRTVTDWLVRRTLAPLVDGRTAPEILGLRVVDPAMGSGAFLVSACRYLAGAAEIAFVRDGHWAAGDVSETDRVALRREVAQKCLYGADLNPMAVQLARLSIWLATLAHEKPLTFLDHHLIVGDSVVGASLADLRRQPPGHHRSARHGLTLFPEEAFEAMVEDVIPQRLRLAREADDAVEVVKAKESLLASLQRHEERLAWKAALDLWCACWFWPTETHPDPPLYGELHSALVNKTTTLPPATTSRWLDDSARVAAAHRFLHWELECPEVFFDGHGRRRPDAGFDAVIGNPPWDMIRGDSGGEDARTSRRLEARQLVSFVRESGVYATASRSHANRYQLFVERALHLTRRGGRIGVVLPSGAISDSGAGPLRRYLFDRASVDTVVGLDNRRGIFPIHRGLRIALMAATAGRPTDRISCRFGVTSADDLALEADSHIFEFTRSFIARASGDDDLGLPEITSALDLRILERLTATVPPLGSPDGWHAHFGRELNATDDRDAFVPATGDSAARMVLEGKQIEPFRVHLDECRQELAAAAGEQLRIPRRARLAYRDVAAATNRLTLIAAIVPARAVTTHTLFVLRTPMSLERQHVLCALLNSFAANYLIRMRVSTHVTTALMSRVRVPVPAPESAESQRLACLTQALASTSGRIDDMREYAELQAIAARLYGLNQAEFEHVLTTFPLIDAEVKTHCVEAFESLNDQPSSLRTAKTQRRGV